MTVLLQTDKVTRRYGTYTALSDVSIAIREGEFISIVGPNGAGKTTLVNVLTGLLKPSEGTVRYRDQDVAGLGPVRLAELGMARAFQLVHVFPNLSVRQTLNVALISQARMKWSFWKPVGGYAEMAERVAQIADLFGMKRKLDAEACTLSQGEKKLLDIASAFALRPEIILLDEPTSGVSSADKHGIMQVLVNAAREIGVKAVIQVEHDMDLVERYSDRVIAILGGRVLADRPPQDFFRDPELIATVIGRPQRQPC
jgi:branched-chain amino acid transport system ATP-binding protein